MVLPARAGPGRRSSGCLFGLKRSVHASTSTEEREGIGNKTIVIHSEATNGEGSRCRAQ